MCMKYINAIVTPYASVLSTPSGGVVTLHAPLGSVRCRDIKDGKAILEDFAVVTDLNFLGTADETHKKENPLEQGKKIGFIIRLTKCSPDVNARKYVDLDSFVIDLAEVKDKGWASKACFDYYNYTHLTKMPEDIRWIPVDGEGRPMAGSYVLKVIVEDIDGDGKQSVQAMCPLQIVSDSQPLSSAFCEADATCQEPN